MLSYRQCHRRRVESAHGLQSAVRIHPARSKRFDGRVGKREHRVAGIDGLRVAPQLPQGGATTVKLIAVLDVVVDEREVVQQFDGGRRR